MLVHAFCSQLYQIKCEDSIKILKGQLPFKKQLEQKEQIHHSVAIRSYTR